MADFRALALQTLNRSNFVNGTEPTATLTVATEIFAGRSNSEAERAAALSVILTSFQGSERETFLSGIVSDSTESALLRRSALLAMSEAQIRASLGLLSNLLRSPATPSELVTAISAVSGNLSLLTLQDDLYNRLQYTESPLEKRSLEANLGRLGDPRVGEAVRDQVARITAFLNPAALEGLTRQDSVEALNILRQAVASDLDINEKLQALQILMKFSIPEVVEYAHELSSDPRPALAAAADAILASRGDSVAIQKVTERLASASSFSFTSEAQSSQYVMLVRGIMQSGDPGALRQIHSILANTGDLQLSSGFRHVMQYLTTQELGGMESFTRQLKSTNDATLVQYAGDIVAAREKFGIEHPFRFTPESLRKILETREAHSRETSSDQKTRAVSVILVAQSDGNGYVNGVSQVVEEAQTQGQKVLVYEVDSDQAVAAALADAARLGSTAESPVDNILFAAHGDRTRIILSAKDQSAASYGGVDFDDSGQLDISDSTLMSQVSRALKNDGRIVVAACTTGEGADLPEVNSNLVRFLREQFPHAAPRGIHGSTNFTTFPTITFDGVGNVDKVEFLYDSFQSYLNDEFEKFPT